MKLFLAIMAALVMGTAAIAQDAYAIRAGDKLRIEVLEDASLNRSVLVPPDGRISLPLAGSVVARGRTVEEVQAELVDRLAANFAAPPNVFVSIEQVYERPVTGNGAAAIPPTVSIYVIGEVAKPGKLLVEPGTTMLQLFAEMGGFSKFAATKRIQLRRVNAAGVEKIYRFDYDAVEAGTSTRGNTVVVEGDVIIVPQRRLFE